MRKAKKTWTIRTASANLAEVFDLACSGGPQRIIKGKEAVVVISADQYQKLKAESGRSESLSQFFAKSPLAKSGIDLTRITDLPRKVKL